MPALTAPAGGLPTPRERARARSADWVAFLPRDRAPARSAAPGGAPKRRGVAAERPKTTPVTLALSAALLPLPPGEPNAWSAFPDFSVLLLQARRASGAQQVARANKAPERSAICALLGCLRRSRGRRCAPIAAQGGTLPQTVLHAHLVRRGVLVRRGAIQIAPSHLAAIATRSCR